MGSISDEKHLIDSTNAFSPPYVPAAEVRKTIRVFFMGSVKEVAEFDKTVSNVLNALYICKAFL